MARLHLCSAALVGLLFYGCSDGTDPVEVECEGACDEWNDLNDPSRIGEFEYAVDALPSTGSLEQMPWPGDAWYMNRDGIAWRWMGQNVASPLERYEQAFGGSGEAIEWERRVHGTAEREVGDWWGHCNGWAAAALLTPEPLHAAELNGVRFEVSDIKALLVEMYMSGPALFIGGRCNQQNIARDQNGYVTDETCRDTNAGAFHVVLTNMLGTQRRGVVADVEGAMAVFNHIIVGYTVDTMTALETEQEACQLVGIEGDYDQINPEAVRFFSVGTTVSYLPQHAVPPSDQPQTQYASDLVEVMQYEYLLEVDANGLIVGGEWLGDSRFQHPDFLWVPTGHGEGDGNDGDNIHVDWNNVQRLHDLSLDPTHVATAGNPGVVEVCDNGVDDDDDWDTDCFDDDCAQAPQCQPETATGCVLAQVPEDVANNTQATATQRSADTDEDEYLAERFSKTIYPEGDVDWYSVTVTDQTFDSLTPWISVTSEDFQEADLEMCLFFVKSNGENVADCREGDQPTTDEASGLAGCCSMNFTYSWGDRKVSLDVESIIGNDSGTAYFRVRAPYSHGLTCGFYLVTYGF